MKWTIPLTHGLCAIVDERDYEELSKYKWHARRTRRKADKYVAVRNRGANEEWPSVMVPMHRQITAAPQGMDVDHINRDPLDNRRSNLRVCTRSQNTMNTGKRYGSSLYKGVSWATQRNKWNARIWKDGRKFNLGFFDDQEEAAIYYDIAAQLFHGEYACLNFPLSKILPPTE